MSQARLIIRKARVWYSPAAVGLTFAWVEVSGFFKDFSIMPKLGRLDTGGYQDVGKRNDKLDPEHQVKFDFYHSRLWTEFSSLMVAELANPDPTYWMAKYQGLVATSADNPCRRVAVSLTDLGTIGGAKNTAAAGQFTLDVEGQIYKSVTAGDPPVDGSFSIEV